MSNQNYLPFQVILSAKKGNKYSFIVNAGNINSFILNTYKANYFNFKINDKPLDEKNYYPFNSLEESTYKLGKTFLKTFETTTSCDVYLTIPKVPAGFYVDSWGGKINWWLYDESYHSDFLNQFSIITSTDEKFQEYYDNNILYIQQKDDFKNSGGTQILKDSEYAGKIYIKIASIIIKGNEVKIIPFLRSNVFSPHRYLRLGDLSNRNIRIYFSTVGKSKAFAADTENYLFSTRNGRGGYYEEGFIKGEEDDPSTEGNEATEDEYYAIPFSFSSRASSTLKLVENSSYFSSPLFINKSIEEIESLVKGEIEKRINYLNDTYVYQGRFKNEKEYEFFRKEDLQIYQIILIYKETLGDKLIMKNAYENIAVYNAILKETTPENADGTKKEIILKTRMKKEDAYGFLGVNTDDLSGIDKIVDLQGFE
jgi:hypothetical protein